HAFDLAFDADVLTRGRLAREHNALMQDRVRTEHALDPHIGEIAHLVAFLHPARAADNAVSVTPARTAHRHLRPEVHREPNNERVRRLRRRKPRPRARIARTRTRAAPVAWPPRFVAHAKTFERALFRTDREIAFHAPALLEVPMRATRREMRL